MSELIHNCAVLNVDARRPSLGPISPSVVKPSGVELFYGIDFTPPKILNLTNRFYPMR